MGYYDPPEYYETITDFTCDKCEHENKDAEATHTGRYSEEGDVTCTECGNEQVVSLGSSCYCSSDYCRC